MPRLRHVSFTTVSMNAVHEIASIVIPELTLEIVSYDQPSDRGDLTTVPVQIAYTPLA